MEELEKLKDFYQIFVLERMRGDMLSHHLYPANELAPSTHEIAKLPLVKQGYYTVKYRDGTVSKNVPLFYPNADDTRWLMTYVKAKGVVLTVKVHDLGLLIAKEK